MRLTQDKLRKGQKLLTTEKGKKKMTKKHFVGALMGVGLGVLAASVSAETGTSLAHGPKGQGLGKGESMSMFKPLESLTMGTAYMKRREASIDWQRVITTVGAFAQPLDGPSDNDRLRTANEALQEFSDEIRALLRGFEDRYDVRVAWKGPGKNCPDVTQEFLKYLRTDQAIKDSCRANRIEEYKQGLMKIVELSGRLKEREKSK